MNLTGFITYATNVYKQTMQQIWDNTGPHNWTVIYIFEQHILNLYKPLPLAHVNQLPLSRL